MNTCKKTLIVVSIVLAALYATALNVKVRAIAAGEPTDRQYPAHSSKNATDKRPLFGILDNLTPPEEKRLEYERINRREQAVGRTLAAAPLIGGGLVVIVLLFLISKKTRKNSNKK